MPENEVQRDALESLASEFTDGCRRGQRPSIADYAVRHPELADEIRELFPTIVAVERLKAARVQSRGGRASLGGVRLERLGEFRLLREIGRGGMGVVFEAEQESLARRVAVKVLPRHALMTPEHLQRFRREARIAAQLTHPNIVPVIAVGEQEGFHYYAMQLIQGVGLDRIVAQMNQAAGKDAAAIPTESLSKVDTEGREPSDEIEADRITAEIPESVSGTVKFSEPASGLAVASPFHDGWSWETAVRIGIQAARALDYAHGQGTLHCDIKPANLLVDAAGRTWVTDFGVAKALQAEQVTRTGELTGTLCYIAPERFQGQTDARSDVYSLGLTLYELLALRPAFEQSDRTALLRCILQGELAPPRRVNPRIPADLETIVLRAVAVDPDDRYPSAGALADDLDRLLDRRPIMARRPTALKRCARWIRQNALVAGLAGVVVVLLAALALALTWPKTTSTESTPADHSAPAEKAKPTPAMPFDDLPRPKPPPEDRWDKEPWRPGGPPGLRGPHEKRPPGEKWPPGEKRPGMHPPPPDDDEDGPFRPRPKRRPAGL